MRIVMPDLESRKWEWHAWFAWRPVRIEGEEGLVLGERLERRMCLRGWSGDASRCWEYRRPSPRWSGHD